MRQVGWTKNSLIIDGIDDWVQMQYLYYENMTVEIVAKPLDINTTKTQYYIANMENGGIGIRKSSQGYNTGVYYIGGIYEGISSKESANIGQIYSMSVGYNGTNMYFKENDNIYKTVKTGNATSPSDWTVFAIGTNPKGTTEGLASTVARSNIEIYSVRIYNRCLTDEEIQHNYKIDKQRFKI